MKPVHGIIHLIDSKPVGLAWINYMGSLRKHEFMFGTK
jgi:hypothetical protein